VSRARRPRLTILTRGRRAAPWAGTHFRSGPGPTRPAGRSGGFAGRMPDRPDHRAGQL